MLTFSICIVFNFGICASLSEINKFEKSSDLLLLENESFQNSINYMWYSNSNFITPIQFPINLKTQQQNLGINIKTILGFEQYDQHNRFIVLSGNIRYKSSFLNAFLSADAFSIENQIDYQPQDIKYERFIRKNAKKPIEGAFDFRFNLPEAYLQSQIKFLTISSGKMKLRWGPGYKGTLGLSGTAFSPFYFYNLNLQFGKLFQATAFFCGYDDETFYWDELKFNDSILVKNTKINLRTNLPRYGAGQRLDLQIGKHVQLGFYELANIFGSNELIRFANPLQVYYLSNHTSGTNNANLLGGMDINVRFNQFRFYGELLNDDITVLENNGNPNKFAFQLGTIFYGNKHLIQTGIEYTHVSRYVYSHDKVLSRHAHWGESMGWPWGNDQDLLNLHAVFAFPHNVKGRAELNYWIKGDGTINDDWYADGKPDLDHAPYWPQNSRKILSAIIAAEYSPLPWITISTYYEPVIENKKLENGVYCYLQVGIPGNRTFELK